MTTPPVSVLIEPKRKCGFRRSGPDGVGLYLMGQGVWMDCGRIPFPLHVCPTCSGGIKFSRAWTWIDPQKLFAEDQEPTCKHIVAAKGLVAPKDELPGLVPDLRRAQQHPAQSCRTCHMNPDNTLSRGGLLWVGQRFYTPQEFIREAKFMGVSKRIAAVPRGFELGEHVVYLAHKRGYYAPGDEAASAGIFTVFRPSHVDLVIDDEKNVPDKAMSMYEKLGDEHCRVVKVIPQPDTQEGIFGTDGQTAAGIDG